MLHNWKTLASGWWCARCGQQGGNGTAPQLAGGQECHGLVPRRFCAGCGARIDASGDHMPPQTNRPEPQP